jgi:D-inositol-3-phosphate glycosyltransferase
VHKRIGVVMYQTSTSKGQELVAQRMVRDFNALGHKAYLITSVYHDGVEAIQAQSLRKTKGYVFVEDPELGIPVVRVDSYAVKWPRRRITFRDFVQVLGRIVDDFKLNVLITHSTLWNGPEEVAKFVAWRRYMKNLGGYKDPIVFCHMSHFQEPSPKHYSMFERTFRMAWNRFSLSQILKTANLVLVVTPLEKDANVEMGADAKKCLLFPSGVNEELFLRYAAADVDEFLEKCRIPKNVKLVSYLGTIEQRKNPLAVLKIAKSLKDRTDIHFVIAGKGDSRYADRVKNESSRLPNVSYLGEIDDKDKTLLIKSSHVNILLSQLEALGLAQLEFMYFGVPVVTSAVGGQSWLVRNGKEGVHAAGPDDIEGAAKAITNLVDDHESWSKLSLNARERARDLASPRILADLDDALTEEIIKESGLKHIPQEARDTLAEPENVLKTWSAGGWRAVATERRLFVKRGFFSRKVTEIPYWHISYIEHTRRYPWKILAAGFLPMLILLLDPLWRAILKATFVSTIEEWVNSVITAVPQLASPENLMILVAVIPMLIAVGAFALQSGTGFNVHGSRTKPIYLPRGFGEVITFIRGIQDKQVGALVQTKKARKSRIKAVEEAAEPAIL